MSVDRTNKLTFVSIGDLLTESFYIPGYQRGYRWQPGQVLALLNDIWDFRTKWMEQRLINVKYCLQPLVVLQRSKNLTIRRSVYARHFAKFGFDEMEDTIGSK